MEEKEIDGRVYEVGYLFAPTISEEELPTIYGNLKELVGSFGGNVISEDIPKMIDLSYSMFKTVKNVSNKFSNAYFGWVKFFMDADKVLELKKKLDLDPNIVRFLIIKTVKENTIAAKRFVHRDSVRRKVPTTKKEGESNEVAPINKEEVDKEIEAMIA